MLLSSSLHLPSGTLLGHWSGQSNKAARNPLIIADGLCQRIAELLPGARHELVALGQLSNPLQAITEERRVPIEENPHARRRRRLVRRRRPLLQARHCGP